MQYDKDKAQQRLKELRELRKWTLSVMGNALNEKIGYESDNYKGMKLSGENGKQTVSQLERGTRGITIDVAFAYADIFGVSLDYILGRSDDWQPEHKTLKDLGFTDNAIVALQSFALRRWREGATIVEGYKKIPAPVEVSEFIAHENFKSLVNIIHLLKETGMDKFTFLEDIRTSDALRRDFFWKFLVQECEQITRKIVEDIAPLTGVIIDKREYLDYAGVIWNNERGETNGETKK